MKEIEYERVNALVATVRGKTHRAEVRLVVDPSRESPCRFVVRVEKKRYNELTFFEEARDLVYDGLLASTLAGAIALAHRLANFTGEKPNDRILVPF